MHHSNKEKGGSGGGAESTAFPMLVFLKFLQESVRIAKRITEGRDRVSTTKKL